MNKVPDGKVIYCRFIVRNGKRIYPTKAKCFRFIVKVA